MMRLLFIFVFFSLFLSCKKDFEQETLPIDFLSSVETFPLSLRKMEWRDFGGADLFFDRESVLIASLNRESSDPVDNGMIEENSERENFYVLRLSILKPGFIQYLILKQQKAIFYKVGLKSEKNFIRIYKIQSKVHILYLSNTGSLIHIEDVLGQKREYVVSENISSFAVDQLNPRGIAMSRTNGELIYCRDDGAIICNKISSNLLASNLDPTLSLFHDQNNRPHIISNVVSGDYDEYERLAYFYYNQNWNEKFLSKERYGHLRATVVQDNGLATICFVSSSVAYIGKIDLENSNTWAEFTGSAPYSDSKRNVPTCMSAESMRAHYLSYIPGLDGKLSYYRDGKKHDPDQGDLFDSFNIIYQLRVLGDEFYAVSYNDGMLRLSIYRQWK